MKSIGRRTRIRAAGTGVLLFLATHTDPAASGPARLVRDVNPTLSEQMGSFPQEHTPFDGFVLFRARTATGGQKLWRTDGTEAGTSLVRDIGPGRLSGLTGSGDPDDFSEFAHEILGPLEGYLG